MQHRITAALVRCLVALAVGGTGLVLAVTTASSEPTPPSHYVPTPPARVRDTRTSGGPIQGTIWTERPGIAPTAVVLTVTDVLDDGDLLRGDGSGTWTPVLHLHRGDTRSMLLIDRGQPLVATVGLQVIEDVVGHWEQVASATSGRFTASPATPVLDSTLGIGAPEGTVPGQHAVDVQVGGLAGVPVGAGSVLVRIGATALRDGYLQAWDTGGGQPMVATMVVQRGATVTSAAIVPLSADGRLTVWSSGEADLRVEVLGWFTGAGASDATEGLVVPEVPFPTSTPVVGEQLSSPDGAARFGALAPTRVLDTRTGLGAPAGAVPDGGQVDLAIAGPAGVPTDAVAVALNVTATGATGPGYVTVWPTGELRPTASNLNLERAGQTIPNLVVVRVGAGGRVSLFSQTSTHLVADVAGYWVPSRATAAGRFVPVRPARVLDTREGLGAPKAPVHDGGDLELVVRGVGGVPAAGVSAVALNVTATGSTGAGFVTVWPEGVRPEASNLNLERPGQTIPNLVIVPVGTDGRVRLHAQTATDLVVDVEAYVTDASAIRSGAGLFVPVPPSRLLDTRARPQRGGLYTAAAVIGGYRADLAVVANGPVPGDAVGAVLVNVTATNPKAPGFVTAYPAATNLPTASNLNVEHAGQTIPNLVLGRLGYLGRLSLYAQADVDLVVDVAGWFAGTPAPIEDLVTPTPPTPPANPGGVSLGTDCAPEGATATSLDGKAVVCSSTLANGRPHPLGGLHWRLA